MNHEVTNRIHTEESCQIIRIQYVSEGFAHLAVSGEQPGMTEYLLRKRLAECH